GADHNSLISVGGKYYFQAIRQFIQQVTGETDWRNRRRKYKEEQAAEK
ncbi:MAG: alpha/beta hydrolase, partial [Candidatus Electrothrix sp. AR4]|nr:alpha/beta hydrolase [Candidatus Electrothrix sp. AR4]